MTPDPAGMVDGPNLYAYVLNDPINFTDPSGLCETRAGSRICITDQQTPNTDFSGFGGRGGGSHPCANASAEEICIPGRRMPPRFPFDAGPTLIIGEPGGRGNNFDPDAIRPQPDSGAIEDVSLEVMSLIPGAAAVKAASLIRRLALLSKAAKASKIAAQAAAKTGFKTQHYSSRLEAAGVNVGRAESAVAREIGAMRSNMTVGSDVRGRLTIEGVRIEYRARLLPNGSVNVGTVFPVAP